MCTWYMYIHVHVHAHVYTCMCTTMNYSVYIKRTYLHVTGPCCYGGCAQGGHTAEKEENNLLSTVMRYTGYQVNGLFDGNFVY